MRRVHCDIAPIPPTPPILTVDKGGGYVGRYDNPDGVPNPNRVSFHLCDDDHPGWGSSIIFGTSSVRFGTPIGPGDYEGPALVVIAPPWPVVPTRERICGVDLRFQGRTIVTEQFGTQPWFELAYQCCHRAEDRASVRTQKKSSPIPDTHLILEFFTSQGSVYPPSGQWLSNAVTPSGEENGWWFRSLVEEVIQDGLVPVVAYDGDNADDPKRGHPNAMRQIPILAKLLDGLHDQILYARLWDSVWYGSSPANVQAFGTAFRAAIPDGYLAIEHQPLRIPLGGMADDYKPGGRMDGYDVLLGLFHDPPNDAYTWQTLGRTIRPYHRPPDQPASDDPHPPLYLLDSPRGPRFYVVFECAEYAWLRHKVSLESLQRFGQYFRNMGARWVCLP